MQIRELFLNGYARIAGVMCPMFAILILLGCEQKTIASVFLAFAALFLTISLKDRRALIPVSVSLLFSLCLYFDVLSGALYYPVLMSFAFFVLFLQSLWDDECFVQKIARRMEPDIPDHALVYCFRVHIVWTVFLALNTAMALYTVRDIRLWSWYNGVLSYALMAMLFILEYAYRMYYRKRMAN